MAQTLHVLPTVPVIKYLVQMHVHVVLIVQTDVMALVQIPTVNLPWLSILKPGIYGLFPIIFKIVCSRPVQTGQLGSRTDWF